MRQAALMALLAVAPRMAAPMPTCMAWTCRASTSRWKGADAEEGAAREKEEDPLNADSVRGGDGGTEGGVVVEEGTRHRGARGVERRGGADGGEVDPEAMEEEDDDDTISYVETGVKASVVEARVVDDVEARDVGGSWWGRRATLASWRVAAS